MSGSAIYLIAIVAVVVTRFNCSSFISRYEQRDIITSTSFLMMIYYFLINDLARPQWKFLLRKRLYYIYDFLGIKSFLPEDTKSFCRLFVCIRLYSNIKILDNYKFWKHIWLTTTLLQILIPKKKLKVLHNSKKVYFDRLHCNIMFKKN